MLIIASQGFVVSCSANGRELVEDCLQQLPDLVITDLKMPELDGISAAEQIGQHYRVPMILVSAHYSPELVPRANAACVQAYLVKPIRLADLSPAIELARRQFDSL